MDAYLKNKLFNGIVFFGYTNGGTAAGAHYSAYCSRPDVYNHHRWVLRKLIPISRAVQRAGHQADPAAKLSPATVRAGEGSVAPSGVAVNAEGQVREAKRHEAGLNRITGRRRGRRRWSPATVATSPTASISSWTRGRRRKWSAIRRSWACADTLVFDEFGLRVLEGKHAAGVLTFKTRNGPSVVQLGSAATVAKSILARIAEGLRLQLTQRALDRDLGIRFPHKAWSRFCQGGKWGTAVVRTGKGSLAVVGGTYAGPMPQWKYFNRQGVAQFVSLNQTAPRPIVVRAFSKAQDVPASEEVVLDTPDARRRHFDAREGHTYCMHLYLDYQDGRWPEVHTGDFRPALTTGRRRASVWSRPVR